MNTVEIIEQATAEGVILALSPTGKITATGIQLAVDKWLPTLREIKNDVLAELLKPVPVALAENERSAWMWQVNLPDRTMIVTTSPASTTAEMKEMYPTAISLEALE